MNADLKLKGLESYLPLHSVVRYWSDRKKKLQVPLFPSYVFVRVDLKERYSFLQASGVIRLVNFDGTPARIPDYQIQDVRRILELGYNPEPSSIFIAIAIKLKLFQAHLRE